ncbi:MAG: Dabb family protein [Rhodobacter sp.]|nr:Dabb family protein [Rhodobacter sp.]
MIRHFVALRFRDGTSDAVKAGLMADLDGLKARIDGILDFQVRPNVSVEDPLVRGFRDVFWFDFKDEAVRDAYLVDAVHQAIGARIVAELEGGADGVFVADYTV